MTQPTVNSIHYPVFQRFEVDEIENAINTPGILEIVEENVKRYVIVDITQTMQDLSRNSELLQLAYDESRGFPWSEKIMRTRADYRHLIAQSRTVSSRVIKESIEVLQHHQTAILEAENGKLQTAVTLLSSYEIILSEMIAQYTDLVTQCVKLAEKSVDALKTVVQSSIIAEQQKVVTRNSIYEFMALADTLNQEIATAKSTNAEVFLIEALKERNTQVKGSIEKVKTLLIDDNNLDKTIASMEITCRALGQLTTAFKTIRMFWEGVQRHCKDQANNEDLKIIAELDLKDEFIRQVEVSGLKWLANFKISHEILLAMQEIDGKYDPLDHLPSKEEDNNNNLFGYLLPTSSSEISYPNFMNDQPDLIAAFSQASEVSKNLQSAFNLSRGFSSSEKTIKLMSDYQLFLTRSLETSSRCKEIAKKALCLYRIGLLALEKEEIEGGTRLISSCGRLVGLISDLCNDFNTENLEVNNPPHNQRRAIISVDNSFIDTMLSAEKDLQSILSQFQENQSKVVKQQRLIEELHREYEKTPANLKAEAKKRLLTVQNELQDLQLEQEKIVNERDLLNEALNSLSVLHKSMTHLHSTTQSFWLNLKDNSQKLNYHPPLLTEGIISKQALVSEIKAAGLNWLSIFQISNATHSAIDNLDKANDAVLGELVSIESPTRSHQIASQDDPSPPSLHDSSTDDFEDPPPTSTPPAETSFYNLIIQKLDSIEKIARFLQHARHDQALDLCMRLTSDIQSIIDEITASENQQRVTYENLKEMLIRATQQHTAIYQKNEQTKKSLRELTTRLQGLNDQNSEISTDYKHLLTKFIEYTKKIEDAETVRNEAVIDLIPLAGAIMGPVTGRLQRMIPGASQIKGIISAVTQDKEGYEILANGLNQKIPGVRAEIESIWKEIEIHQSSINLAQQEIDSLNIEIHELDVEIKQAGRLLTYFKNLKASFGGVYTKYKLLLIDVDSINESFDVEVIKSALIADFLSALGEGRKQILSLLLFD